jgi:hypothetical protein
VIDVIASRISNDISESGSYSTFGSQADRSADQADRYEDYEFMSLESSFSAILLTMNSFVPDLPEKSRTNC